jgi:hypothetical protein
MKNMDITVDIMERAPQISGIQLMKKYEQSYRKSAIFIK